MKKAVSLLIVGLSLILTSFVPQTHINFKAKITNDDIDNLSIKVIDPNEKELELNAKGTEFTFNMLPNSFVGIVISADGYYEKKVMVNSDDLMGKEEYLFETELLSRDKYYINDSETDVLPLDFVVFHKKKKEVVTITSKLSQYLVFQKG